MIYLGRTTTNKINTIKTRPGGIYYTTDTNTFYIFTPDKTWVKFAENDIIPEVSKKRYTNKQLKCPSCGAPHKETEEQCYWCGNYFVSEDYYE